MILSLLARCIPPLNIATPKGYHGFSHPFEADLLKSSHAMFAKTYRIHSYILCILYVFIIYMYNMRMTRHRWNNSSHHTIIYSGWELNVLLSVRTANKASEFNYHDFTSTRSIVEEKKVVFSAEKVFSSALTIDQNGTLNGDE